MNDDRKLAIVIPRYGKEIFGGAEIHCRWICEHLAKRFKVEVLTTCAIDALRWDNYYPPEKEVLDGVLIRRFLLSDRSRSRFESLNHKRMVYADGLTKSEELDWNKNMGSYSQDLFDFLKKNRRKYVCFIFFTYLFPTTVFGVPIVKDRAFLVPTVHDEPYVYLSIYDEVFNNLRGIFFNSLEEREFVLERFPNIHARHVIVGTGIKYPDSKIVTGDFQLHHKLKDPYIIYVGKLSAGKGFNHLLENFIKYLGEDDFKVQLVVLGEKQMELPDHPNVKFLGIVSEEEKFTAIGKSTFLINPSQNESLSLALLEAWSMQTPVLVNGRCNVLVGQCKRSNGGLWYWNYSEFRGCLNWFFENRDLSKKLGQNGKLYLEKNYNWEIVEEKYFSIIQEYL